MGGAHLHPADQYAEEEQPEAGSAEVLLSASPTEGRGPGGDLEGSRGLKKVLGGGIMGFLVHVNGFLGLKGV